MRRVPRTIIAAVALGALWLVLVRGYADYLARPLPERALTLDSAQPEALVRSAESALRQGRADLALSLAQRALRTQPLEGRALRVLGAVAELSGDRDTANALMQAAAARAPRDSATQFWLAINALADRDLDRALAKLDRLVRVEPELQGDVFPILATVATNPVGARAMAGYLIADSPWRASFLSGLISQAGVADLRRLFRAIEAAGGRLTDEEFDQFAMRLWGARQWRSLRAWIKHRSPGPSATLVHDGGFDGDGRGPFLGWSQRRVAGADTQIAANAGNGRTALRVSFHDRRVPYAHVEQALLLPPGRYRLSVQARPVDLKTALGIGWVLSCVENGKTLGQTESLLGSSDWRPTSAHFEVPENDCGGQTLVLKLAARIAAEQQAAGVIWFDDLSITPETVSVSPGAAESGG